MFKVFRPFGKDNIIGNYIFWHCLISGGYITAFVYQFAYSQQTILLHFLPLIAFNTLLFIFLNISVYYREKLNRYMWAGIFSCIFTLYFTVLFIIYLLNWVSNLNWGSNVVFSFFVSLPKQIESVLILADVPQAAFYLLLAFLLSIIFLVSYRVASGFWLYINVQDGQVKVQKKLLYSCAVIVYMSFYVHITYERTSPRQWASEPIINIATLKSDAFDYPLQRMEARRDQALQVTFRQENNEILHSGKPRKNVIVIIVDALRADHMGVYGYKRKTTPFLSALQKSGKTQKVKTAISTCSESACGIVSILSSRRFKYVGYGLYQMHDLLKDAGYQTHFILGSGHGLNNLQGLYGENVDSFTDGRDFPEGMPINDDRGVISKLQSLKDIDEKPFFIYFHLMSSHILSIKEDRFKLYEPLPGSFATMNAMVHSAEKVDKSTNKYDVGVLQADHYISEIFNILKKKNILENSIVVITSDHGDALGERGNYQHTYNLYAEETNIPLIFYNADKPLKNLRYATHIDIAPTIIDLLELPIFDTWQGVSLVSPIDGERVTFHQTIRKNKEIAIILESKKYLYKLIATLKNEKISDYRLFDLYADKTESKNIINSDITLTNRMKVLLINEFVGNN